MIAEPNIVDVLELKAWGLDANAYRPAHLAEEATHESLAGVMLPPLENVELTACAKACLDGVAARADLHAEFRGLEWRLAVVNLHALIAFQRRLVLPDETDVKVIGPQDWRALTALSFGPPRSTAHRCERRDTFVSANPDLVLRPSPGGFRFYGGSPFFEVASYAGRSFLRDGYHRAYDLLRGGVVFVPAVVVAAHTLDEVGAVGTGCFAESILLSDRPPLVADFLSHTLTHRYTRPRLVKTIRVTIEESFVPAD